jgi:hypothetical protein
MQGHAQRSRIAWLDQRASIVKNRERARDTATTQEKPSNASKNRRQKNQVAPESNPAGDEACRSVPDQRGPASRGGRRFGR